MDRTDGLVVCPNDPSSNPAEGNLQCFLYNVIWKDENPVLLEPLL